MNFKKILKIGFYYAYLAEYLILLLLIHSVRTEEFHSFVNDEVIKTSLQGVINPSYFDLSTIINHYIDKNEIDALKSSFSFSFENKTANDRAPPSYSILMNFQSDGTTSVQVLDLFNQITYYYDKGLCKHGQIFDPSINRCRDVFCVEGYIFTSEGCKPDPNFNSSTSFIDTSKIPELLELEATLMSKLCTIIDKNCSKTSLIDSTDELISEFRKTLSFRLNINSSRIDNITILFNDLNTYNSTLVSLSSILNATGDSEIDYSDYDIQYIDNEEFVVVNDTIERIRLSFIILNNKNYPDDNDEIINYYYTLFRLNFDSYPFDLFGKRILIVNVTDINARKSWCQEPDKNQFMSSNFSLLASFDSNERARYFVYVNETDTLYSTGDYYLTIGVASRSSINSNQKMSSFMLKDHIGVNNKEFTDVTNQLLESLNGDVIVAKLLTVCNRKPKIRIECPDHETVRLNICELKSYKNRTICYIDKCYSINEYEYDAEEEDHIRVCKFDDHKNNETYDNNLKKTSSIHGYVSFVSNLLSLTAMIFTLVTFALFNELRNIPGWNCINLTLALSLAQLSFLVGSLATTIPFLCLITALLTHYGFLAAFFNMNVIAFDLYRNFRSKSSHILINRINLKSRLLKYAGYAWITPLLIVIICVVIDVTTKTKSFMFKPCYASYFQDCSSSSTFSINILSKTIVNQNQSNVLASHQCLSGSAPNNITSSSPIVQYCYIQNGKANLLFFGAPIGLILIINAVFYIQTICTIRKKRQKQRDIKIRRFSRVKCPGDNDVKFYIRMAVIMGFTWIIGFFL